MATTDNPEKIQRTTGGQAGVRGYLVQTLIALLDSLTSDPPFVQVTIEPDNVSEKVDILWENSNGNRAIQVKSTEGQFTEGDVRRWAGEMEAAGSASEYRLCLVGLHSASVAALDRVGHVIIDTKNLDIVGFREQAAHRLDQLLRKEGLDSGTGKDREMLADALTARLAEYSTKGRPLSRKELIDLLRGWVAVAPRKDPQIAPSRLPHVTGKLFGRELKLAALDEVWLNPATHVLTIVAWGGVGKTSLVVEWMNRLAAKNWPGVQRVFDWSFYSQGSREQAATSADAFVAAALRFFGDEKMAGSSASPWDKGARLAELIAQQRTLLVLDGIEALQHPPGPFTGKLKDPTIEYLLRGLARRNSGLCIVTTRETITNLAPYHNTTTPEWKLEHLGEEAGAALLHEIGVRGPDNELREASREVTGHALTLYLLGTFLAQAHEGDIRKRDVVKFEKADADVQGGHAFRVMAAYEKWLADGDVRGQRQLAVLRLMAFFDRPAEPNCIDTLRCPPVIPGLTESLTDLLEIDWNTTTSDLGKLGLLQTSPFEPRVTRGFSKERADIQLEAYSRFTDPPLGKSEEFRSPQTFGIQGGLVLDVHPLLRVYFAEQLKKQSTTAWREGHRRLYEHLKALVLFWPEGVDGLQPLYQAIPHGCHAGLYEETLNVYRDRVLRGTHKFYSQRELGQGSADLAAMTCFFEQPWKRVFSSLSGRAQSWVLNEAASRLLDLGRLIEALDPFRIATTWAVQRKDWDHAASGANNLSEVELRLGDVNSAVKNTFEAVIFADRSHNGMLHMISRTSVGDALHQAGRRTEAFQYFREAEKMQSVSQPGEPFLYSLQGFQYCDLLLAKTELVAWRRFLDPSRKHSALGSLAAGCQIVSQRASQSLSVARRNNWLRDIGLDHLTLARITVYAMNLDPRKNHNRDALANNLDAALSKLLVCGSQDNLPLGLLTRAWRRFMEGENDDAQADLDEAWEIAERGPMRLHMADIHLYRARLFKDKPELKRARVLIEQCGYWRRKEELEDAEAASKSW